MVKQSTMLATRHGLTDSTSHHIKNSEWGAIAYLTQSKYGNTNIYNNSYFEGEGSYTSITGMSGKSENDYTSSGYKKIKKIYNIDGSIEITYTDNNGNALDSSKSPKTFYPYNNVYGYRGSSTGTIYGIYDLSGGSCEYVAGYVANDALKKYKQEYTNDYEKDEYVYNDEKDELGNSLDTSANNYILNAKKFGDAIYEVSKSGGGGVNSWNQNYSYFPCGGMPFFRRSCPFDNSHSGVYFFDNDYNGAAYYKSRFSSCSS